MANERDAGHRRRLLSTLATFRPARQRDPGAEYQMADATNGAPVAPSGDSSLHGEALSELLRADAMREVRQTLWRARATQELPGRPIYFLHIMKTGGTSLTAAMQKLAGGRPTLTGLFLDDLVCVPSYVLDQAVLVAGHFGREARELLPASFVTCTILRDPVERTLSHFEHLRRDPLVTDESPGFSLEEFVHAPRWRTHYENYQARQLVHRIGLRDVWDRWSPSERFASLGMPYPRTHPLPLQSLFDCSPMAELGDELEASAFDALDSLDEVGSCDKVGELFDRLASSWGVSSPPPMPRLNVTDCRVPVSRVPASLLRVIRDATQVDLSLYRAVSDSRSRVGRRQAS